VRVEQLFGQKRWQQSAKKKSERTLPAVASTLQESDTTLAPGERLIVPLSLILLDRREEIDDGDRKDSQNGFQRILKSDHGTVFQTELYASFKGIPAKRDTYFVRKVRESFKPPSNPDIADYAFGPEWILTGFTMSGENVLLDSRSPDLVTVIQEGPGSCPILYLWSRDEDRWIRLSKILHQANSMVCEQSETIAFDGFINKFRIAEEELERNAISKVRLLITLKDESILELVPNGFLSAVSTDIELYANEEVELSFALPVEVKEADIASSRLTITGYYDRYPALLVSKL
jgi:hypothetical protein